MSMALSGPHPAFFPGEVIAGSGAVHMAERYLLSDHLYSLRSQALLFLSVMAHHYLLRIQANLLCLSENLIS